MCLAVPARILEVVDKEAEVNFGGVRRRVSLIFVPEARVGDYVIVHTGFALNVLDEEEAQETLKLFEELDALSSESTSEGAGS